MCSEFLRIKFTKEDEFKYLSHLDLIRIFYRVLVRAGIKLSYSKGFNPKPIMSFSNPTPLGIESFAEYCDIEIIEQMGTLEFIKAVNKVLPKQIKVVGAKTISRDTPKLMSQISVVFYKFYLGFDIDEEKKHFESDIKNEMGYLNKNDLEKMKVLILEKLRDEFTKEIEKNYEIFNSIYSFNFNLIKNINKEIVYINNKNCKKNSYEIVLDVFGFAKIFNDRNNFIFKFYSFLDFLKNFLSRYKRNKIDIEIKSFQKVEMYIKINDKLVTPLDIV